jgi:hypothetical protein
MRVVIKIAILVISLSFFANAQMSSVPVQPRAAQPKTNTTPSKPISTPSVAVPARPIIVQQDDTWYYVLILLLVLGLVGAIVFSLKNRKAKSLAKDLKESSSDKLIFNKDDGSVDGDRELEWLRKNKELIDKRKGRSRLTNGNNPNRLPDSSILTKKNLEEVVIVMNDDEKGVQLANRKEAPIFSITCVERPELIGQLSYSRDESLLGAIEQIQDEFEEDEKVRELAVRIAAMFKNRNSVEALGQVALYDLSATLRVKALIALSEFNHESVFETILLACADPTREVRAAAARALTRVSFNRADAWTRIASLKDHWHLKQAADATIESGFVQRSFERLVHNDYKQVYEAFALMNLLVKADKIELILDRLENSKSMDVKIAILHVLKVSEATTALPYLYSVYSRKDLPEDFIEALDLVIHRLGSPV